MKLKTRKNNVNKSKSWFFKKIDKIDKTNQANPKIKTETGKHTKDTSYQYQIITTDLIDIKMIKEMPSTILCKLI